MRLRDGHCVRGWAPPTLLWFPTASCSLLTPSVLLRHTSVHTFLCGTSSYSPVISCGCLNYKNAFLLAHCILWHKILWWRECLEVRHKSSTCWGKRTNQIKWADAVLKALIFNWLPFSQPSLNFPGKCPCYLSLLGPPQPLMPLCSLGEVPLTCSWVLLFCLPGA